VEPVDPAPGHAAVVADGGVPGHQRGGDRGGDRGRGCPDDHRLVGQLVTQQLWFLPVYLVMIALTPVMLAAQRRWGLAVAAGLAAAAALVSAAAAVPHQAAAGYANYLLVWGSIHQWGLASRDGMLTRTRWRPYALAAAGAALLAGLAPPGCSRLT
jgi:hypothetical protein